jgi:hypothetical protein
MAIELEALQLGVFIDLGRARISLELIQGV